MLAERYADRHPDLADARAFDETDQEEWVQAVLSSTASPSPSNAAAAA